MTTIGESYYEYGKKMPNDTTVTTVTDTSVGGNIPLAKNNDNNPAEPFQIERTTSHTGTTQKEYKHSETTIYNAFSIEGIKADKKLVEQISGFSLEQLRNMEQKDLNRLVTSFKEAIKDTKVNGQINLDAAIDKAKNYDILLKNNWSTKNLKSATNGKSIGEKMDEFFSEEVRSGKSFDKLDENKKIELLERYFTEWYKEQLAEATTLEDKERIYKLQRQDFSKALVNTDDKNKEIAWKAIEHLLANNKVQGLESLLRSYDSKEIKTQHADEMGQSIIESFKEQDVFNEYTSGEDVTYGTSLIAANQSKEGRIKTHSALHEDAKKFNEENKEILESIALKETKEANGEEVTYTQEELEVKRQRDNYYTATSAGEIIGTASNNVMNDEEKTYVMQTIITDAKELPNYNDVIKNISTYTKSNADKIAISKNEFTEIMDKSTNGEYSKIANTTNISGSTQTKANISNQKETPDENINNSTTQQYQTNPIINNTTEADDIENSSPEKIEQITTSTADNKDKKNVITKIRKFSLQIGRKILNKLVESGKIKNSKFEDRIIDKLKSLSPPTILSLFTNSSDNTKVYLYENGVIKNSTILVNMPREQQNKLPEEIKEKLQEATQKS